jgi:hypothetical protein
MKLSVIMNPSLSHFHVTFALQSPVTAILFDKGFSCEDLITVAAGVYCKELQKSAGNPGKEWQSGSIAALHKCGNTLNYNPHVHLIGTRELVNTSTGEILRSTLLNYQRIRHSWMNAELRLFRRNGIFTENEIREIRERYKFLSPLSRTFPVLLCLFMLQIRSIVSPGAQPMRRSRK